jgi:hypothetical protein
MTGADAPTLEEPPLPGALHSTRHRIRAHVCRHTRRREGTITLSPHEVAHDKIEARALGWRTESGGAACGADAADGAGERSSATQWAGTRRATSRWVQGDAV